MNQLTDEKFEAIYDKYYSLLINIANKYVRNYFDSEDIVQEVFIQFYCNNIHINDDNQIKYYLIRLTINHSLNVLKRSKKVLFDEEYINTLADVSSNDEETEREDEIYSSICELKDSYKTIIILYYYEKCSLKQISNILKISESNAAMRLSRAREKLKKQIEKKRGYKK